MRVTEDSGAFAKVGLSVFIKLDHAAKISLAQKTGRDMQIRAAISVSFSYHFGKAPGRDDIAGMDEPVQVTGGFLYRFSHVIVAVKVEDVGNEIEGILIVLDFRAEAR
jgi:hypothetical protein